MLLSLCSKSFSFFFLLNSCFVQLHAFNICLKLLKNAGVKEKHVWFQFNQHNEALLGWSSGKWLGLGIPADSGADPGFFLRRGCTHLLLYFNTNKPHTFFFLQNTNCTRKLQVISGGGGVHPLHPPPRSAAETPGNSWWGVCHPVLQILTLFHTKKYNFPHLFSDQSFKIHTHLKGWSAIRGHGLFGEGNCCETKIILVHASCCLTAKSGQTK